MKGMPSVGRYSWGMLGQRVATSITQTLRSDFARKVAATFGTRVLLLLLGMATGVITTRTLGPEGRGLYATLLTVGAIGVQFGNLGLHASNTYYVARDRSLLGVLVGNSLLIGLGLGSVGVLLAWGFFAFFPQSSPLPGNLLTLALLWTPFGLAYLLMQNLLLGIQEVGAYNRVELVTKIVTFACIGVIIWFGVVSPASLFLTSFAMLVLGLLWVIWRLTHSQAGAQGSLLPVSYSFRLFQSGLRYGFKAYIAAFFAYMVLRIDLLMVKQMLGAEQAGYYSVAANTADLVLMLPLVIGTLLFPQLSTMTDAHQKWQLTRRAALAVGLITSLLAIVAGWLAEPVLTILYGDDFLPTLPAFLWLLPAVVVIAVNSIFMNYFASLGMPLITVYSPGIAALLNIIANLWLLPHWGIVGASLSSLGAYSLMLIFSILYIYWRKPAR